MLFTFERDRDRVFDRLGAALRRVDHDLTFEFGPVLSDGRREFIVSADGHRRAFPAVQQLVATAPQLERWIVTPFRPPKSTDHSIQVGDLSLGAEDVWFTSEPDGDKVGITLYLRGLENRDDNQFGIISYLLLDNALGEFTVETRVGFIERKPLPADPESCGLRPFREITSVVDTTIH